MYLEHAHHINIYEMGRNLHVLTLSATNTGHISASALLFWTLDKFPLTDKEFCAFPVLWVVTFQAGSGIRIKTAQAGRAVWGTKLWWSWGRSSSAHRKSPRTVLNTLCVKSPWSNSALSLLNRQGLRGTSFLNAYAECLGNSLTQRSCCT